MWCSLVILKMLSVRSVEEMIAIYTPADIVEKLCVSNTDCLKTIVAMAITTITSILPILFQYSVEKSMDTITEEIDIHLYQ